ncbi:hypothetical protein Tco_0682083 [Tanacetum coccineum]|uniref:Uncharacterized protein n=1 Tax=Tanacetum coccineum TaxID=301880 RepID=A0ABQ4XQ72_9ASTR
MFHHFLLMNAGCPNRPLAKISKNPHKHPNLEDTNQENLSVANGSVQPMRDASVNGKEYILDIVDDYTRFTRTLREYYRRTAVQRHRALHDILQVTISSGLVPNPPSSTPFIPPSRTDWDLLFQPMFDESLNPPPYVDLQAPKVIAPIPEVVAPCNICCINSGSPSQLSLSATNDAFLTSVEPKNYKDALTQASWIEEQMQGELHEFERLEV